MDLWKRVMLAAYDERVATQRKPLFLSSLFGKNPGERVVSAIERVDVDVIRDGRLKATDVIRGGGVGHTNFTGIFSAHEYKPPLYWEETPITATMLNKRVPGEQNFGEGSAMARLAYHASTAQREQVMLIEREIERMASEVLQLGTITLVNNESLDFGKKAAHSVTPATKWDAVGGNPLADLISICDVIFQDGKMKPNTVLFGSAAWAAFVSNSTVTAYLNTNLIQPGRIDPSEALAGATLQGRLWVGDYQLDLYTYNEFYITGAGVATPYVTTDTAIVFNRDARLVKAFAACEVLQTAEQKYRDLGMPAVPQLTQGEVIPFAYEKPPTALIVGVQSAPLLVPVAIDTIATLINVDV